MLSLVAAHARGITVFRNVAELRAKESDRLQAIIETLDQLGIDAWNEGDDLYVEGQPGFEVPDDIELDAHGDHRLAMTWALLGLIGDKPVKVKGFDETVGVSYPDFLKDFERLVK